MSKRVIKYTVISAFMLLMGAAHAHAQLYPERSIVRQGNKDYHNKDFVGSETDYRRALEKAPGSYEAEFNLGNSLYRQGRFDEAAQVFSKLGADSLRPEHSSESYFNDGNALFQQRKLQEALEAYKNSLRRNPSDIEAKYNLAYVKKLLEDNKDDKNDQDQDQNKDQNQDNQNDQNNQDNQDQNDQDQDGGDNDKDKNQNQPPPPKKDQQQQDQDQRQSGISREEAEQMLDAVQMNEDKTRDKMDEKKAAAMGAASGKNW